MQVCSRTLRFLLALAFVPFIAFRLVAAPSITSLSVTSGPVGTAVTITGTNFGSPQGSSTVTFNGVTASVTTWSTTSIATTVPSGATTGNVVVTVSGSASNGKSFTVTPYISSLSVSSGAVGAAVTISGTTFGSSQGSSTVKFNGTSATVTSWGASAIAVKVPTGATSGNVVVTVSSQASNGIAFTVLPAPTISSLSPTSGAVGASVSIVGANFGSSQGSGSVSFAGSNAVVTEWGSSIITATVPSGAASGNVLVNAAGVPSNGVSFTVLPAPNITGLSVTTGAAGTPVTISGTNFGSVQSSGSVTFNGTVAPVTSWGASSIAVKVPSGATSGNVVVNASGVPSNGVGFTVIPTPTVASLSPTSGVVGTEVTISGSSFGATQGSSTITLSGTSVTVVTWSDTSIVAIVPSGAVTGSFSITRNGQTGNSGTFTVSALPSGWSDADVGSVGPAGSASYANGTFAVKGAGSGILSTTADQFNFAYQSLTGDGTIIARVTGIQGGSGPYVGVTIRETLNPSATNVQILSSGHTVWMVQRTTTGASSSYESNINGSWSWVKLVRAGNVFNGYASTDGVNWTQVASAQTITMAQTVYIGLEVSSGDNSNLTTGTIDVSVRSWPC